MSIKDLVSPAVYAFGGPGSGRKPDDLSEDAHVASAKTLVRNTVENHEIAYKAHKAARNAHEKLGNTLPGQGKPAEGLAHGEKADAHSKQMLQHLYAIHKLKTTVAARTLSSLVSPAVRDGRVTSTIEEPALSLLAFSGAAFYALPGIEGPNNAANERDGLPNPAGKPALSSLKDVLSTGQYVHPIHGWKLDVTPDKIKKYCAAFSEMKSNGVKVPIYADHKPGAANTLGYVKDLFQGGPDAIKNHPEFAKLPVDKAPLDPNKMYAIHEWNSPEAMKMAHGVGQVSVLIDKKMQDGTGKKYGEATRHVAVTPEPIVPGQDGFCQLSLNDSDSVRVACLSREN